MASLSNSPEQLLSSATPEKICEVNAANFMAEVMDISRQRLVLVHFHSPRSALSKQLGAVLEKVVREEKAALRLVRVNIDENTTLCGQLRVQSVPTVYAFFQGQVADAFSGNLPEEQVRNWLRQLVKVTGAAQGGDGEEDIRSALDQAEEHFAQGDFATSKAIYDDILGFAPEEARAFAGSLRCQVALGDAEGAKKSLLSAKPKLAQNKALDSVRAAIEMAEETKEKEGQTGPLQEKVLANPDDHQARYDLALAFYAAHMPEKAMENLLEIVARDRKWNDDAARKQLVKLFEILGPSDPLTAFFRKRLSSLLFS